MGEAGAVSVEEGIAKTLNLKLGDTLRFDIGGVTTDARATAADVKDLADAVAVEAQGLQDEVRRFLTDVRAA